MEDSSLYFTATAGEALFSGAASGVLTSESIPLAVATRNIGVGTHKVFVACEVTVALVGSAHSMDVDLLTDDNAAMSSPAVIGPGGTTQPLFTVAAEAAIGTKYYAELPESTSYQDFLGARTYARTDGTAPSAGSLRIYLTLEPGVNHIYPTTTIV